MDQTIVAILTGALVAFIGMFVAEPVLLGLCRIFGIYAVVQERTARVYMLFGKVIGILDEPGLYFLPGKLGAAAFVINFLAALADKYDLQAIIIFAIFVFFNYHNGLSIPTFFQSIIDGLKNIF